MPDATINETLLESQLTRLEEARQWSPRVISRLEMFIRSADDYDLFRINPIRYAADRSMDEQEAVDLFLYAASVGLFEMQWHLLCAYCAHVVNSLRELDQVHPHYTCTFCGAENHASLDEYIQVAFTISPQVRDIAYHHPDTLSIEDYYFRYHFSRGVKPLEDGTSFEDVVGIISKHIGYVQPGERQTLELDLGPGMLQAKDLSHNASVVFFLNAQDDPEVLNVPVRLEDGQFRAEGRMLMPVNVEQPAARFKFPKTDELNSTRLVVEYANLMDKRSPLWVLHYPAGFESQYLHFEPFLSGKQLLNSQTFRDLFRSQVIAGDEGIAIQDIALLFTDLTGSTAMYDRIGDANAYYLVRQHFDALSTAIVDNGGAIVKTIGDAVMASFMTPDQAVQAALQMVERLNAFNSTISEHLTLKIGIHRGHCIAVTLNERVDYFGQTVNIAARVQSLAGANEIYVSEDARRHPGVEDLLTDYLVTPEAVSVKGVSGKLNVYRVTLPEG